MDNAQSSSVHNLGWWWVPDMNWRISESINGESLIDQAVERDRVTNVDAQMKVPVNSREYAELAMQQKWWATEAGRATVGQWQIGDRPESSKNVAKKP